MKYSLGEFEEIVMLTVGILYDEAYGVAVKDEIEQRLKRKVSGGALQSALHRLEKKGYLESRGGKPKRFFTITAYGKSALEESRDVRMELWNAIPEMALKINFG